MSQIKLWTKAARGWILALGLASLPALAQGTQGRVILLSDDFKMLVGLKSRSLSSEAEKTSAIPGTRPLHLELSSNELKYVRSHLAQVERARKKLTETLEKKALGKKKALREERRALQTARMKTAGTEDSTLGRSLFESLLEEANLEAESTQAIEKFDADHAIELAYVEVDGIRIVQSIEIGNRAVWNSKDTSKLAKR